MVSHLQPRVFFLIRIALAVALLGVTKGADASEALTTTERRDLQREGRVIVDLLQNLNYASRQFHQIEAKEMIDHFIGRIDPDKLIFTQPEREAIHRRFDRTFKTVYILKGDDEPAQEIFDRLRENVQRRVKWVKARLDGSIDLEADETMASDETRPPAADRAEADRRWEQQLKQALIAEILRGNDRDAAEAEVGRRFERWSKEYEAVSPVEVREQFWEAIIGMFDAHSGYFGVESADEFEVMMKGAICGVGLDVWMNEGKCTIAGVLAGGSAEEQGVLRSGDEILGLAEADGAWVETSGLRLRQVLGKMRGKSGTTLRIAYRSGPNAERRETALTRRDIILADQRASGGVAEIPRPGAAPTKIGWIDLPDFYASGENSAQASATRDVKDLIGQMKARGVSGIVIDLRENPGGALSEAVGLAGLFIPSGVVVMSRDSAKKVTELSVEPNEPFFTGPLVVLTSRRSASASEVFAGAMKFHRRALVVGSARTFGKGTMQQYIDLNRSSLHDATMSRWGTLRVTAGKIYFPDGTAPQRTGATADIVLEDSKDPGAKYEEDLPYALPTDRIEASTVQPATGGVVSLTPELLAKLKAAAAERVGTWAEFALRRRNRELARKMTADEDISLRLSRRVEQRDTIDRDYESLRRELLTFVASSAYRFEEIELPAVQQARAEHAKFVHARATKDGGANPGQLWGATYFYETSPGHLRDIRLSEFSFRRQALNADTLAPVIAAASGLTTEPTAVASALRSIATVEDLTADIVVGRMTEALHADKADDAPHVRAGVDAMLGRMVESSPSLRYRGPAIDVGLREALRVAADWSAEDRSSPAATANVEHAAP